MTPCKICGNHTELYDVVDLHKACNPENAYPQGLKGIPVYYERCNVCGLIFTRHFDNYAPSDWARDIYNSEYKKFDPDYGGNRARRNARVLRILLSSHKTSVVGLDYGGGNGDLARLLRLAGFNFDCQDPFGVSEISSSKIGHYNLVTAFEVFEHLTDPIAVLASILDYMTHDSAIIIIGTAASDRRINVSSRLTWWYAAPRNGHVSLFSKRSLSALAQHFDLHYASPLAGTHIMSRSPIPRAMLATLVLAKIAIKVEEVTLRIIGGA